MSLMSCHAKYGFMLCRFVFNCVSYFGCFVINYVSYYKYFVFNCDSYLNVVSFKNLLNIVHILMCFVFLIKLCFIFNNVV